MPSLICPTFIVLIFVDFQKNSRFIDTVINRCTTTLVSTLFFNKLVYRDIS